MRCFGCGSSTLSFCSSGPSEKGRQGVVVCMELQQTDSPLVCVTTRSSKYSLLCKIGADAKRRGARTVQTAPRVDRATRGALFDPVWTLVVSFRAVFDPVPKETPLNFRAPRENGGKTARSGAEGVQKWPKRDPRVAWATRGALLEYCGRPFFDSISAFARGSKLLGGNAPGPVVFLTVRPCYGVA